MQQLMSKKELLSETGISYGQLYRWKREGLIPEEWFIKQSSFTGHETFLPRERVLNRVETILRLKDEHSLPELAEMFSPRAPHLIPLDEISEKFKIEAELADEISKLYGKQEFSIMEAVLITSACEAVADSSLKELLRAGSEMNLQEVGSGATIIIFKVQGEYHLMIIKGAGMPIFDGSIEVIKSVSVDEAIEAILQKKGGQ